MQNLTISFFIRGTRLNKDGKAPIYCRITLNGRKTQFSVSRWVLPNKWNGSKMKGTTQEAKELNQYISNTNNEVYSIYNSLSASGKHFTADTIRNELLEKTSHVTTLVELIEYHNQLLREREDYAPATIKRYGTLQRQIQDFLNYQYNVRDYHLQDLNFEFLSNYDHFLRTVRKCNNNSAVKYIRNLRKIIRLALDNDWLMKDPFSKYRGKIKESEKTFLTEQELRSIIDKEIGVGRLDEVRDVFVFCCLTGLSYVDVASLSPNDITTKIDGYKVIFNNRQKTGTQAKIILDDLAIEIINKYQERPDLKINNKVLPVKSNQKYNAYLKELGDICGIKKELTSHVARHTCGTYLLNQGMRLESVKEFLGHKNTRQTEGYAKLLDKTLTADFEKVRNKFSKQA